MATGDGPPICEAEGCTEQATPTRASDGRWLCKKHRHRLGTYGYAVASEVSPPIPIQPSNRAEAAPDKRVRELRRMYKRGKLGSYCEGLLAEEIRRGREEAEKRKRAMRGE